MSYPFYKRIRQDSTYAAFTPAMSVSLNDDSLRTPRRRGLIMAAGQEMYVMSDHMSTDMICLLINNFV